LSANCFKFFYLIKNLNFVILKYADVAELVDALDLGSSGTTRGSSSLPVRTFYSLNKEQKLEKSVTTLEGCERQVELFVNNEELLPHFEKAYNEAIPKINLKGFRKGKVPIKVIKQYYGKQIEAEALPEISSEFFNKFLKEDNIRVVGTPRLKDIVPKDSGYNFIITFDVYPEFELKNYQGITIDEPFHKVTDEEIEKEIERICRNSGKLEEADKITDELFIAGVKISEIDALTQVPIIGGKPQETQIFLADETVLPDIKASLINSTVGDSFIYSPKTSDKFAPEKTFRIIINQISKLIPSEFTNEFVDSYSGGKFKTTEEFREEIELQIQEEWDRKSREEMENQIITRLVDLNNFEVPQSIVWNVIESMADSIRKRYSNTPQAQSLTTESMAEGLRPLAERTVRWEIIKNKIIEKEDIKVEDHDVEDMVEIEAKRLNSDKNAIRSRIIQNQQITDKILTKKALDIIIDFAVTNEISFEEYSERRNIDHEHDHDMHNHEHEY
jgi:trigger factor